METPSSLPQPRMPVLPPGGARDRRWYWMGIGFVSALVLVGLVGLVFSFTRSEDEAPVAATPSPTPTATSSPRSTSTATPSASPTVNPADWTFEVLNGSGVTGVAAKAAEVIKERGYTVSRVGNAEESDLKETQLLVTAERSATAAALLADLKKEFPIEEVDATLESDSFTARLIVGKDWEAPTSSPTTSPTTSPKTSPTPTPKP